MSQIDEIRLKIDIVELIGSLGVSLRKTGRSYVGFCPFHPNSRTPAFTVYPDTQSFYCFGCHASGTIFDFLMRKQGVDFRSALEQMAARAGVRLEAQSDDARREDAERSRLIELNSLVARVFHHVLVVTKHGEPGRAYVEQRQLNATAIESFQLGYSPDDWSFLFTYLTERKGFRAEEVVAAGLAIRHEHGHYYDRFRGRLIFPIRNMKGDVVGFGGRALGSDAPKYINTPETLLYKKGELLYGLDLAREAIRLEDRTILVEGYIDVISAHQHGFRNVVAPLGTALTKAHATLLKRLSHHVYMALDADAAGQRATLKGLNALRESREGDGQLVPTAQGALRLESEVNLRIIRMPEGRDPDEVIRADPELWRRLVGEAVPLMEFYLGAYTADLDLTQPEAQRTALDRLLPLLTELDGAQQRVYVSRVEQLVGIRAELIIDLLRSGRRQPTQLQPGEQLRRGRTVAQPPATPPQPTATAESPLPTRRPAVRTDEAYLLGLAMRHQTVDAAVEALLEEGLSKHPAMRELFGGGLEDLLEDPVNQEIWRQLSSLPPDWRPLTPEDLERWVTQLDESVRNEARRLMSMTRPEDFRYRQEAEQCARKLRIEQVKQRIARLQTHSRTMTDAEQVQEVIVMLTRVNTYLATLQIPRRSSTFPDLRNTMGSE